MDKICLYDATLREGNQAEEISFSVEDKLRITRKLDDIGIDFSLMFHIRLRYYDKY